MRCASRVSIIIFIVIYGLTSTSSEPAPQTPLAEAVPKKEHVQCSQLELLCLSKDQLHYADGKCYSPLERGPCEKGQMVVLEIGTNVKGLQGRCEEQRCPPGLVPFLGRCQTEAEVRMSLCDRGHLYLDPTGNPRCGDFPGWRNLLRSYVRCSPRKKRQVKFSLGKKTKNTNKVTWVNNFNCVKDDNGNCVTYVSGNQPIIIIEPEK